MDKNINIFLIVFAFLFCSCTTSVDVRRSIQASTGIGSQADPSTAVIPVYLDPDREPPEPVTVIIEKPIFIPQAAPAAAALQGRQAVEAANKAIVQPQDYSNSARIYDYDRDFVYELYCQPFRISDITLQPGEKVLEAPFVSDSERWMLGAGVSYEAGNSVQHIYVKPTEANLTASLIINTDLRIYHFIIRSFRDIYMPIVRWRYHDRDMPQNYTGTKPAQSLGALDTDPALLDLKNLSFNYKITYGIFRRPTWLPTLAYDDGRKTYVNFPPQVLTMELPAVFEGRADIVNYRVHQNVMIIDKLIEKITIKLGDKIVTIEKKKGNQ
jgi:type IV secretion system protein VirB9